MDGRAAFAAVSIGVVFVLMGLMERAPDAPTDQQKAQAHQRIVSLIEYARITYELKPYAVAVYWDDPADYGLSDNTIAFADCGDRNVLMFEPQRATRRFDDLMTDSIPHEVAHLVLCQTGDGWDNANHGPRFRRVMAELQHYVETLP